MSYPRTRNVPVPEAVVGVVMMMFLAIACRGSKNLPNPPLMYGSAANAEALAGPIEAPGDDGRRLKYRFPCPIVAFGAVLPATGEMKIVFVVAPLTEATCVISALFVTLVAPPITSH